MFEKHDTPMIAGNQPELNDNKYPHLHGLWHVLDKGITLYAFGYLKKKPNCRIKIYLKDTGMVKNKAEGHLEIDFTEKLKEHCPDTEEVIENKVPT
eukprot:10545744-Ditylum_brightwellii.AAC.1